MSSYRPCFLPSVMYNSGMNIQAEARKIGLIQEAKIGLLVMGRKRPGFDPDWGREMLAAVEGALETLPWEAVIPSRNINDAAGLHTALEDCGDVSALIVVQPTISDGRLAPLLSRLWSKPVIIWATPEKPVGKMISANSLVGSHVMAATLRQMSHPLEFVYGDPREAETRRALSEAVQAVHAADSIRGRIFGLIGYHAPGFVDLHADPIFINKQLGSQLYHTGNVEFIQLLRSLNPSDLQDDISAFNALPWSEAEATEMAGDGSAGTAMEMQARYYRAFRTIMSDQSLDALAFRCWPDLPSEVGHWPYLALARLVSEGFPLAMEGDVDAAICGRIAESAGIGPVYLSDWLAHDAEHIVIWHTGAAPFQLSENIRLSLQFNNHLPTVVDADIKTMPAATLFRIWRFQDQYCMAVLEGETVEPGQARMASNGLFRTRTADVRTWFENLLQQGLPHHVCLVAGHQAALLRRIARLLNMRWLSGRDS